MYAFQLLEGRLNHDLACLISMHVLFPVKTKALEGRYRREVSDFQGQKWLYFIDLMSSDAEDDRTPEGLYRWAADNQEYLPTKCPVPAGTVIFPIYQCHTGKMRDRTKRPYRCRPSPFRYTNIFTAPPHPPVPWHNVRSTERLASHNSELLVTEPWGLNDD